MHADSATDPVADGRGPRRTGRPRATDRATIARVALRLFAEQGFDRTTVDDIAAEAGIGRRTLFRYFPSKNELVWGDFDAERRRLRAHLDARPTQEPTMRAIRRAVVATNDFGPDDLPELRLRMRLLTTVPTLQAYSTLRYGEWREDIARFAAGRLGGDARSLVPSALGHATLGVTLASFLRWVELDGTTALRPILDHGLATLEAGFPDHVAPDAPHDTDTDDR